MKSAQGLVPFHQTAIAVLRGDAQHIDCLTELGVLPKGHDEGYDKAEVAVVQATVAYLLAQSVVPDAAKGEVFTAAVEAVVNSLGDKMLTAAVAHLFVNHDQNDEAGDIVETALGRDDIVETTRQALEWLATEIGLDAGQFDESAVGD